MSNLTLGLEEFDKLKVTVEKQGASLETISFRLGQMMKTMESQMNFLEELFTKFVIGKGRKELTLAQMDDVSNNILLSNRELSKKFGIKTIVVSRYRDLLVEKYLRGDGSSQSVVSTAAKFGTSISKVTEIRQSIGLAKPDIETNGADFSVLGSREDIVFALTRGGKSSSDLLREHKLRVSRQRMQQVLAKKFGIAVGAEDRTFEWYARHLSKGNEELFKKLVDKPALEIRLATTPISVLAAEFGIITRTLSNYFRVRLGIDTSKALLNRSRMELVCSNSSCKRPDRKFSRSTSIVRRDRQRNPEKLDFCSKRCFGQYVGATIGFVAHPENAGRGRKVSIEKST